MIRRFSFKNQYFNNKIIILLAMGVFFGLFFSCNSVKADYVENNLIDDTMFLDASSMSQAQIQSFLTDRGGYIANYYSFSNRDNGNISAAQIIYESAQDYGISPKVILATMQKEESLVTDPSPAAVQINFAMGYGCYDSTGCSSYYGFYNQVAGATWQLRFNFERARGNTAWWNPSISYACNNSTQYYSAALKPGSYVTFYDDYGTSYKSFTINNAATAAFYCYTPHAYPGSAAEYYSGSYNFVVDYERWWGLTQPSLAISSRISISSVSEGVFTNVPTTASFNITNNTNDPMSTLVAVTVRDSSGGNHDYPLKTITIGAHSTAAYSSTQTFTQEGNYTFGITSFTNGIWNNDYPSSSSIDNQRSVSLDLQPMPTISAGPTLDISNVHAGEAVNLSFTVQNNSSQPVSIGQIALALRDPEGKNVDLKLVSPGNIASNSQYVYTQPFIPKKSGVYTGFIVDTDNNNSFWNSTDFPAQGVNIPRTIQFTVKPNPTVTTSLKSDNVSPHVGQTANITYSVKNYSNSSVSLGYIGLAGRDPSGRNVDPGPALPITLAAGEEKVFNFNTTFNSAGDYHYFIASTRDYSAWETGPTVEGNSVTKDLKLVVLPDTTLTKGPVIGTSSLHAGQKTSASFMIRNYSTGNKYVGYVGLAIRDPFGRNVDAGGADITIQANNEYTFISNVSFSVPGIYTAWVTSYHDGHWDTTYPVVDSSAAIRTIQFTVKPNPTVTTSLKSDNVSPHVGQTANITYSVKNYSNSSVSLGYIGLAGRDPSGRNVDPGPALPITLAAGEEKVFNFNTTFNSAGDYHYFIASTRDYSAWETGPTVEGNSVTKDLKLVVLP